MTDNSPNKSIGYITQSFPGLTTTFIYREVFALRNSGFDVTTFSIRKPDVTGLSEESRGLMDSTHYALPLQPARFLWAHIKATITSPIKYYSTFFMLMTMRGESFSNRRRTFFHFMEAINLLSSAQKAGIGHIHAHFSVNAATVALVFSRMLGISFSFTVHNNFFTDRIVLREKLNKARFIVAISEFSKQYLLDLFPDDDIADKFQIVHCGVSPEKFNQANPPETDRPLIYSVSQVVERKGYPYLIEACKILKERGCKFRCQIAGDGPELGLLKELIGKYNLQDDVELLGRVFQEDLIAQLNQAHIFALPCITAKNGDMDGVPVVLMESMSMGIPCISTFVSGIPELIENGEGIVVEEKDITAFADGLQKLLEDKELRLLLGKAGQSKVQADYNIKDNVAKLCQLFERSLGNE
jgi:colanic acid/amylovoran biosynthesis glycosyltransferase